MRARMWIAAGLLWAGAGACGGEGVLPRETALDAGGASADSGAAIAPDAALANVGQACRPGRGDCRAPAGGRCLEAIDPAGALAGLLQPLVDYFAADQDGGAPGGPALDGPTELTVAAPGGYCSAACTRDEECGARGACLSALSLWQLLAPEEAMQTDGFVGEPGLCLEPCDRNADCRQREGYECRGALQNLVRVNSMPLPLERPLFCLPPAPAP